MALAIGVCAVFDYWRDNGHCFVCGSGDYNMVRRLTIWAAWTRHARKRKNGSRLATGSPRGNATARPKKEGKKG